MAAFIDICVSSLSTLRSLISRVLTHFVTSSSSAEVNFVKTNVLKLRHKVWNVNSEVKDLLISLISLSDAYVTNEVSYHEYLASFYFSPQLQLTLKTNGLKLRYMAWNLFQKWNTCLRLSLEPCVTWISFSFQVYFAVKIRGLARLRKPFTLVKMFHALTWFLEWTQHPRRFR